jgi:hypothetical protein
MGGSRTPLADLRAILGERLGLSMTRGLVSLTDETPEKRRASDVSTGNGISDEDHDPAGGCGVPALYSTVYRLVKSGELDAFRPRNA